MKNLIEIILNLNKEAKNILSILQKTGPLTKSDLLIQTNMKLTSLNRIMKPLLDSKLIVDVGIGESTGGRKPLMYDVNGREIFVIGIDISRTYTQITLTNIKMEIIKKSKFFMDETCTPEKTIDLILSMFNQMISDIDSKSKRIIGVGLGAVGPLDREQGIIKNPIKFQSDSWRNVNIKQMLEKKLKLPVMIDNGANTAVLAEYIFGLGKGLENIAYFNCGIGIRTGVISSGYIVRTVNNAEDAFGHMIIDVDGELCTCGNYGCIECYSTILSIENKFKSLVKQGRFTNINKELQEINYIDICYAAANADDQLAKEVIISAATILGSGISNFIGLLNPQMIILSGPLARNSNLFYDVCSEIALKKSFPKDENKIIFTKGYFEEDSAISVGAAAMFVEELLNT